MKRLLALFFLFCVSTIVAAQGLNLNFTSSGLTGWTFSSGGTQNPSQYSSVGVGASIVTGVTNFYDGQYTWNIKPYTGQYMASLQPGYSGESYSLMTSTLGLSSASQTSLQNFLNTYNGGGATNATNASYMYFPGLSLTAGQKFTVAWNFVATDYVPYNDTSITTLVATSGGGLATVNNVVGQYSVLGAINPGAGNYSTNDYGSTGWQVATYSIATTGTYKLGFASFNLGDTINSPILLVSGKQGTTLNGTTPFSPIAPNAGSSAPPPPPPPPGFTDLKFGRYQIADSQWNVQACTQTATCVINSTNPGTMYKIPWTSGQWSWQTGQYVQFSLTGNATNPYEGKVYNSDGTLAGTIGTGHIISMGTDSSGHDLFFFVGSDNDTGQLFSTNTGFTGTGGYTWTGTLNPSTSEVDTFAAGGSTTPLNAGETVGNVSSAPTVVSTSTSDSVSVSSSVGSTTTTTNTTTWSNTNYSVVGTATPTTTTTTTTPVTTTTYSDGSTTTTNGTSSSTSSITWDYTVTGPNAAPVSPYINNNNNGVYITQINAGSSNTVVADQSGHGNYIDISLGGSSNTIRTGQGYTFNNQGTATESATASNYNVAGLTVSGNTNTVVNTQVGLSNSSIFKVTGNTNTATVNQTGNSNQSYGLISGDTNSSTITQNGNSNIASINLYGNSNVASISQTGNSHGAVLNLINAGGANTVSVVQTGTGDAYSLQQTCTNPSGCGLTVIRNK